MPRPLHSLSRAEIAEICARHFGCEVSAGGFMAGEIAVNVAVEPADGAGRLVLKGEYPNPAMMPEHADWVCRVQQRAHAAGLPVAGQRPAVEPFAPPGGESSGVLALVDIDGELAMFRLQEYLPGSVAAGRDSYPDYPAQVGRLAARLADALAAAAPEPAPVLHPWAFETTGANVAFACDRIRTLEAAGRVPADYGAALSADVALARRAALAFERRVRPRLPELPRQVVHQDVNDFNLLVADGRITGLIDFGDCRSAPRLAEAAIAGSYTMLGRADPRAAFAAFAAAYQEAAEHPLAPAEARLIELSALARLCLNACTWTARALTAGHGDPQAEYGRARMRRTWPVVRAVAAAVLAEAEAA
ncbi:phosphotransferase [Brevibacterium sp. BRM-1]|uniref:phosphotransferase n=1 Tax=Brevibacterium sp. BRM-1 TaxID=2999062 RepID=UPI0022819CBD|nr:phosphotransferase [Brevibacterium sp. BRM-1]WAL39472.1 phosphotransferase [Brevibacterium sp. BRM-1]